MRVNCLVCGGRGGWSLNYTDGRVVMCKTCHGTGEELDPSTRSFLLDLAIEGRRIGEASRPPKSP